jgi:uncharacterized protein YndB with AHSA1/START domain
VKTLTKDPVVSTGLLIRRPPPVVYEAIVDPLVTTRFWFTKGSARLDSGQPVRWEWEMYGAGTDVTVALLEPDRRIVMDWDGPGGRTRVEWLLEPRGEDQTMVTVTDSGLHGDGDAIVAAALDSMGGFSTVLCAMKAFLEHGIALNVIADKFPDAHVADWKGQ